jgi:hypothetical protein
LKIFVGVLIGIALASVFFLNRPQNIPEKTKSEFQNLSVNEARKFAEAKTPDEKLKAAEELYGKMMILFLADLGLQLQRSRGVDFAVSADRETIAAGTIPVASASGVPLTCPPCAQTVSAGPGKKTEPKKPVPEQFGSSPYFQKMTPELRKVLGTFAGQLTFTAGNKTGRIDSVLFVVNLEQSGPSGALKGTVQVMLTDDTGKTYSRNVGKGGNKSIRYSAGDGMIYIEASPVSFFVFRATEFNRDTIRGDYFDEDKLVGHAILYRQ